MTLRPKQGRMAQPQQHKQVFIGQSTATSYNPYLAPQSMNNPSQNPPTRVKKAIILHTCGVYPKAQM